MSESIESTASAAAEQTFEAPPPSPMPAQLPGEAARSRLLELAGELRRSHNRKLLVEYLQVRRALR